MKRSTKIIAWLLLVTMAAVCALGCTKKGAEFQTAPVAGSITYQGQAVRGGSVVFRPILVVGTQDNQTGKPASAEVQQDGTFVLSTYGKRDGAVVGKHEILYTPVYAPAETYEDKPAPSPYAGLIPKTKEVEIAKGKNQVEIELVENPALKRRAGSRPRV